MPKRILSGVVTSNQNAQTVTVSVERRFKHPLLQKTVRKSKKYRAHDENNQFNVGDAVRTERLHGSGPAFAPADASGHHCRDDGVPGCRPRLRARLERRLSGTARWPPRRVARLRGAARRLYTLA